MNFTRKWAIGAWADRAGLSYVAIDQPIEIDGVRHYVDTYGRIVKSPECGVPRPVLNYEETPTAWYFSYQSTAEMQAIIKMVIS